MLDVNSLSVEYKNSQQLALDSISFSAKSGELIVISGPSGSGKSTLAKTILGLIPAFENANIEGEILFKEQNLFSLNRKDRIELMGYVPQYPSDFTTSLLVEEEIVFKLENLGIEPKKILKLLKEIISLLEIEELQERLITELSSGELQRVSLASALAYLPPILILDEPVARIDPKAEVEITRILKEIASHGHLVLVFEHRLDYMLSVADRLIILDKGRITSDGDPRKNLSLLSKIDPPEVSILKLPGNKTNFLTIEAALESFSPDVEKIIDHLDTSSETMSFEIEPAILECKNISFKYSRNSNTILNNISFSVPKGQVVGLMGINGSGKSTLFKLISGVLKPSSGSITISGKKINSARKAGKELVYIPENAKLFLVGPTPLRDLDKIWKDENKAKNFYSKLGLTSLMNKKLYHLSEGQRRLFAIINAFQLDDKIILLDEPTIALDRNGRNMLQKFLLKAKDENKIVLIASNDPRVFPYFDRIIVLKDNQILYDDIPRNVLYNLEENTDLIPNQVVRFVQLLKNKKNIQLPHFISVEEINNQLGGEK